MHRLTHFCSDGRSCRRTDSLYDGLFCPSGYQKLPNDQLGNCSASCPARCVRGRFCLPCTRRPRPRPSFPMHGGASRLPLCRCASYVCTCRACRKIVEAQLVVAPRVIVLGQATNTTLALSLPSQPLRPVTVTLAVTMANSAPVSVTLGTTQVTFTTANWAQPQRVPVTLVPHAVQFGNAEAGVCFAVASEDPDYHALSVLPSQVVVQWPLCSAADLVQSIGECDPGTRPLPGCCAVCVTVVVHHAPRSAPPASTAQRPSSAPSCLPGAHRSTAPTAQTQPRAPVG